MELIPDLETTFTTTGSVDIHIKTSENFEQDKPTNISLHSKEMKILEESVTVTNSDSNMAINVTAHEYDLDRSFYVIHLAQILEPDTDYIISIKFVAVLNDDLSGFFRSKYTKPDGTITWLAVTQFEWGGARQSFPCFDEPDKKAIFNIKLGRTENMTAVSNMPLLDIKESKIIQDDTQKGYAQRKVK